MKNKFFFITLLAVVCLPANAEQACQIKSALLGAHYQITKSVVTKQAKIEKSAIKTESKDMTLWRSPQKVLTVNGEQSTTWIKLINGSVQKTTHFDHFKRSIEYPAKSMTDERWQQLRQFIANTQRHALNFIGSKQEGCWQQETYQWENETTHVTGTLVWNANLKLVSALTLTQGQQKSHWQLEKIEQDEDVIMQAFNRRANYQSTDFADIADNESDPFLVEMINLGFIEHGVSGFYNAQGENIATAHNH
jgi:hypothetical protein